MTTFHNSLVKRALSPQSGNNTVLNGVTIDLAGADGIDFICEVGAQDSTVVWKVQTGTASDASDMADVTGLTQSFSASDDNKVTVLSLGKSTKRYARIVATLGNGTAQLVSACALIRGVRMVPVTQDFGGVFVPSA